MYFIINEADAVVYRTEFLDDVEAWFYKYPEHSHYTVEFESLED